MACVLHLSDTHFGTEQPAVMDALVDLAARQRPDLLVLSGDITQRARPQQFQAARAFVGRLGVPLLAIPGNHDIPLWRWDLRLFRPLARYRQAFGPDLAPVHATPELLVLGVDTTRRWRHKQGQVSAGQVEQVARQLAAARPAQLRLVVVHQPAAVPAPSEAHNRLRGADAALARWAAAGADLVLGGHIHWPAVIEVPGLARPLNVVLAGTAVSRRVRDGRPNSVNLLHWLPGQPGGPCRIERWDHDAAQQAFTRHSTHTVQLRPAG